MPYKNRTVRPGRTARTVQTETGEELTPPADWTLLPPGDGALTKLVKARGPTWLVQVRVGRRVMSRGIWACRDHIEAAGKELAVRRADPQYHLRRERELAGKAKKHQEYVQEFKRAVLAFLDFHPRHAILADRFATKVTELATPVGSGTVARTERIPLPDRARAAVIAWLRHQTTGYDRMTIARVKGRRREVRRELAGRSLELLHPYRHGEDFPPACPLNRALTAEGHAAFGKPSESGDSPDNA
jgi:hypothetical protein